MKTYTIVIAEKARKQLKKLPKNITRKLLEIIKNLRTNPRPYGYKKLKGEKLFCIRKGIYMTFCKSINRDKNIQKTFFFHNFSFLETIFQIHDSSYYSHFYGISRLTITINV